MKHLTIINISVIDQSLFLENAPVISSGDMNEDYIEFYFNEMWDGYAKTAVFYREFDGEKYQALIDDENKALIPYEVTDEKGLIYFGVFGVKDDNVLTSDVMAYEIVQGSFKSGVSPVAPSPDIYEQIINEFKSTRDEMRAAYNSITSITNANIIKAVNAAYDEVY